MYIVRDKKTNAVIHQNPAPLRQNLKPEQVYAQFDAETMEIGKIDGPLPQHYHIKKGKIIEWSLDEKLKAGIITLEPHQKIENNSIVEKTLSEKVEDGLLSLDPYLKITGEGAQQQIIEKTMEEKVADGLITLTPEQKLTGKGEHSRIVQKTLSEKIKDGLLSIAPTQKIVGEGENESIVTKPLSEQVSEGIITLARNQRLEGNEIVTMTAREMYDRGLASLDEVKTERIAFFSELAFAKRREIIPDYMQQNAALGLYSKSKEETIRKTIKAFKDEFKRIKGKIEKARTIKGIDAVKEKFPWEILKD